MASPTTVPVVTLPGRDPMEARRRCLDEGIALSCRDGRLRISAARMPIIEDVDRLVNALRNLCRESTFPDVESL